MKNPEKKQKLFSFTKEELSWIFYDWANSAYILIIVTAVFPNFFKKIIASGLSDNISSSYLGYSSSFYALIIAFLSPFLGALADYNKFKKRFLAFFFSLGIVTTLLLTFIQKDQWLTGLLIFMISSIGFSGANIFYDSFLTDVTSEKRMHWISSAGFAFGYFGSTIPYTLCLILFILLPKDQINISIRLSFIITAVWWSLFAIPLFKNVRQKYYLDKTKSIIKDTFIRLLKTFSEIKQYKYIFLFLVSYFFYIDGVDTIIKMAVPYALDLNINLTTNNLMIILLAIQLIAFPFSLIYGYFAKRFPDKIIFILLTAISIYIFIVIYAFYIKTIIHFWILSILVGMAQGGIQSLSRSYFSLIIPKDKSAEFFGFYNIFGKFAAILGPLILGIITQLKNIRFGVLGIIPLFLIGIIFLLFQLQQKNNNLN